MKAGQQCHSKHGPAESPPSGFAAAASYPFATIPVGVLEFNGQPFGLTAITKGRGEPLLFRLPTVWEKTFPRRLSEFLLEAEDKGMENHGSQNEESGAL